MKTNPRHPEQNGRIAVALDDLRDCCADLARRRCTILGARAGLELHRAVIVIAAPPPRARRGLDVGTMVTTHDRITYAGRIGPCQVQWTEPKGAHA